MKKSLIISVIFTVTLSLTACGDVSRKPDISASDFSENISLGEITYNGSTNGETFLIGADGKAVLTEDISEIHDKNGQPTDILDKDNFGAVICDGFAYVFEQNSSAKYRRINVGDKTGELVVRSARAQFNRFDYEGSEIELEGAVILSGVLSVPKKDEVNPTAIEGEMTFKCSRDGAIKISPEFLSENGVIAAPQNFDNFEIALCKFSECKVDLGEVKPGDTVNAEITVQNVKMGCGIQGIANYTYAEIVGFKKL